MNDHLRQAYRYHRARKATASTAILYARRDVAAGKRRYGAPTPLTFNPPCQPDRSFQHVRWVENAAAGLRLVGYADEIVKSIGHRGWFTNEFQDETFRGIVYQLPTRRGNLRFAYGYADPNNDDAALLCFDPCDDKDDAARWADRFAEIHAEREREYQAGWQAGNHYVELGETIAACRAKARALVRDMKAARRAGVPTYRTICDALRDAIADYRQESREAHEKREELANEFSRSEAFDDVIHGRA